MITVFREFHSICENRFFQIEATAIGQEELQREAMEISRALSSIVCLLLLISLCIFPCVFSKSPRPISDLEIRKKKSECYADIESGLWGQQCKASPIAKENCALRCLSPVCYQLIYESDPLEEGEKDLIRSQEYKYCLYKASLGESLEGVRGIF